MPINNPRPRLLNSVAQTASSAAAGRDIAVIATGLVQGLEAFASAARAVAAEREQIEAGLEKVRAAKAEMKFTTELEKRLMEFDPSQPDALERLTTDAAGMVADATGATTFKNDADQQLFAVRLEQISTRAINEALKAAKRYGFDEAERLFGEHAGRLLNLIRNAPDAAGSLLDSAREQTDRLLSAMDPAKRAVAESELASAVVRAKIEGLAERGQYGRARKLLSSSEAGVLEQGTRTALDRRINEIETVRRTEFLRSTMQQVEDLELAIMRGEAGEEDIRQAEKRGLFRDREGTRNQLIALADRIQQQRMEEQERQRKLLEKAAEDKDKQGFIAVDSQSEADKLFSTMYSPENFTNDGELIRASVAFAKDTGFMPTVVRGKIIAAEKAGDATDLATYAQLTESFALSLPGVDLGAGPRIAMVRALADALGGDYGRAAQRVASGELTSDKIKGLEDRFNEEAKELDFEDLLEDVPGYQPTGEFRIAFTKALRLTYYMNGGDMELAQKQAAALLQQSGWGLSEFAGSDDPVLVKYPPEAFFTSLAGMTGPKVMRTAIEHDLEEYLKTVPGFEGLEGRLPAYRLVADNETKAAIRSGQRPSWVVQVADPVLTGMFMPLTDAAGNELRWTPPKEEDVTPELQVKLDKLSKNEARKTFFFQNWLTEMPDLPPYARPELMN